MYVLKHCIDSKEGIGQPHSTAIDTNTGTSRREEEHNRYP